MYLGEEYSATISNLSLDFTQIKIGVAVSEWHSKITENMYFGACQALNKVGLLSQNILVRMNVPGAYELPFAAQLLAKKQNIDAVICLGCLIKGATQHFDFIAHTVANGICEVGLKYEKPIIFGVLTTQNLEQAQERSGGKLGNKGVEGLITALKMLALKKNYQ